ncbi:hypothetical protein DFH08DRAFT_987201 [Mycena albidolilacea]|uniref:Uncharacterized protein n=1 Tax=Mycena albidolilacea TaxID=1033008 RepID=A0AAD7A9W3_9AGAR|nr:hypothetical protein DFH08DRAFT_987201 [Mycena albidolilacea]
MFSSREKINLAEYIGTLHLAVNLAAQMIVALGVRVGESPSEDTRGTGLTDGQSILCCSCEEASNVVRYGFRFSGTFRAPGRPSVKIEICRRATQHYNGIQGEPAHWTDYRLNITWLWEHLDELKLYRTARVAWGSDGPKNLRSCDKAKHNRKTLNQSPSVIETDIAQSTITSRRRRFTALSRDLHVLISSHCGRRSSSRNIFTVQKPLPLVPALSALGYRKFYEIWKMRLECFYTTGTTISVTSATFDERWTESSIDITGMTQVLRLPETRFSPNAVPPARNTLRQTSTGAVVAHDLILRLGVEETAVHRGRAPKRIAPKPVRTPAAAFSEYLAFVGERSCPLSLPTRRMDPSVISQTDVRRNDTMRPVDQNRKPRADPLGSPGDKSGGRKESEYTEFAVFSQPKISQDLANVSRDNGPTVSGAPVCGDRIPTRTYLVNCNGTEHIKV